MITWDQLYMSMAYLIAMKSKDRSTHVGCVIVGEDNSVRTLGFNGFPRGINDDDDHKHERPEKYFWAEHAERNAIYNARSDIRGSRAYVNFLPCADCTRALIQTGVQQIMVDERFSKAHSTGSDKFDDSHRVSLNMLAEAGVKLTWYTGPIVTEIVGFVGGETLKLDV